MNRKIIFLTYPISIFTFVRHNLIMLAIKHRNLMRKINELERVDACFYDDDL